jgi:Rps23 Pro-64 3,4-dihydroxylase Tpa1-like proline 4-hydroxylase
MPILLDNRQIRERVKMSEIVKLKDDTFLINNFLSEEECEKVISYLEFLVSSFKLKWNQISFYESYAMGFWKTDPDLLKFGLPEDYFEQLKEKIKLACEQVIGRDLSEISYHAQKWTDGAFASFHSDNTDEHGNSTAFIRSKYAAFLYLNESFEGGKLNWKNYDITVTPKTGMIAIFDGGFGNEHEVTTVKNGTRYTIGSFWDNADSVYTEEQQQSWADELKVVRSEQEELYKVWEQDRQRGFVPVYKGKGEQ